MFKLFHAQQPAIEELCRQFCVRRLELFGSATSERFERFDRETSDLDFLVEFERECPMGQFHQCFDFHPTLARLFCRTVDLVEQSAIRNPYFRQAVDDGQRVLLVSQVPPQTAHGSE